MEVSGTTKGKTSNAAKEKNGEPEEVPYVKEMMRGKFEKEPRRRRGGRSDGRLGRTSLTGKELDDSDA